MTSVDTLPYKTSQNLKFSKFLPNHNQIWQGSLDSVSFDEEGIKAEMLKADTKLYIFS